MSGFLSTTVIRTDEHGQRMDTNGHIPTQTDTNGHKRMQVDAIQYNGQNQTQMDNSR